MFKIFVLTLILLVSLVGCGRGDELFYLKDEPVFVRVIPIAEQVAEQVSEQVIVQDEEADVWIHWDDGVTQFGCRAEDDYRILYVIENGVRRQIAAFPLIFIDVAYSSSPPFIMQLDVVDDWVIVSVGDIQGSAGIFYGDLYRIRRDGGEFEPSRFGWWSTEWRFFAANGWIYHHAWNPQELHGWFRFRPDGSEIEHLEDFPNILYLADDGYFYGFYWTGEIRDGINIANFVRWQSDGGEPIVLFEGINLLPAPEYAGYMGFRDISVVDEYVLFTAFLWGHLPGDGWRGSLLYSEDYRVDKDGESLTQLGFFKEITPFGRRVAAEFLGDFWSLFGYSNNWFCVDTNTHFTLCIETLQWIKTGGKQRLYWGGTLLEHGSPRVVEYDGRIFGADGNEITGVPFVRHHDDPWFPNVATRFSLHNITNTGIPDIIITFFPVYPIWEACMQGFIGETIVYRFINGEYRKIGMLPYHNFHLFTNDCEIIVFYNDGANGFYGYYLLRFSGDEFTAENIFTPEHLFREWNIHHSRENFHHNPNRTMFYTGIPLTEIPTRGDLWHEIREMFTPSR
ncbi:MAG: hypothetical protein FWB80_06010 [Defluviitaleaceae bacterium]|nr:hypothetical protein [Defluviitaleaceae bacterium]